VISAGSELAIEAHPGYSGFDIEIDGHAQDIDGRAFAITLEEANLRLVELEQPGLGLNALRRRGLITDSPRVLARDKREPHSPTS
jgi:NAD+ kinase